ncbi:132 kDa protein [Durusdinium trenchii]|uniref:132 kDa protein n=1 Tax=Durusdinium trenchii TaxID=1381693 RepID=A0ABP0JJM7_9DINO
MDCKGRHALSCMSGGDSVVVHNAVRDLLHDYCQRAQVRPQLEAPGILPGRRRPADILVRGAAGLFPRLPDGSRPHGLAPLALDVAVVNALGESHWDETRRHSGAAASGYAARKRVHNHTAAVCDQAGAVYLPLVWEAQGGCAKETRAFLHRLLGLAAVVEDCSPDTVRARLHDQLAILLARAGGRAVRRRRIGPPGGAVAKHAVGELLLEV